MELIYIAESKQFPGMVKIGRTDRDIQTRMEELSEENYGTSDYIGDSEWEAIRVIKVENNESAEAILHQHFSDSRVESSRELFYTNNPDAMADEALTVVDGTDFITSFDSISTLFGGLSIVSAVSGITVLLRTFFPDNAEVWKVSKTLNNWQKRLEIKTTSSKTKLGAILYGSLWGMFTVSKTVGEFVPRIVEEVIKEVNEDKTKQTYFKFLEMQIDEIGEENVEYATAVALKKYQNYEINDLFSEQWRQFEKIWAAKNTDVAYRDFMKELRSHIPNEIRGPLKGFERVDERTAHSNSKMNDRNFRENLKGFGLVPANPIVFSSAINVHLYLERITWGGNPIEFERDCSQYSPNLKRNGQEVLIDKWKIFDSRSKKLITNFYVCSYFTYNTTKAPEGFVYRTAKSIREEPLEQFEDYMERIKSLKPDEFKDQVVKSMAARGQKVPENIDFEEIRRSIISDKTNPRAPKKEYELSEVEKAEVEAEVNKKMEELFGPETYFDKLTGKLIKGVIKTLPNEFRPIPFQDRDYKRNPAPKVLPRTDFNDEEEQEENGSSYDYGQDDDKTKSNSSGNVRWKGTPFKKVQPSWREHDTGHCFIATATMGDYNDPVVKELRKLRDEFILKRFWGKKFVMFYYKYGSSIANVIRGNLIFRKISYYFLVMPMFALSKVIRSFIQSQQSK